MAAPSPAAELVPVRAIKLGVVENVDVGMQRLAWSKDGRWIAAGFWREQSDLNGELIGLDLRVIDPASGEITYKAAIDRFKQAVPLKDIVWVASETQTVVDFLYAGDSRVERWTPPSPPRGKCFSCAELGYTAKDASPSENRSARIGPSPGLGLGTGNDKRVVRDANGKECVLTVPEASGIGFGAGLGDVEASPDRSTAAGLFQKTKEDDTTLSELSMLVWDLRDTLALVAAAPAMEPTPAAKRPRRAPLDTAMTPQKIVEELFAAVEQRDADRFRKYVDSAFGLHDATGRGDDAFRFIESVRSDIDNLQPIFYRVDVVSVADLRDSVAKVDVRWNRRTQAKISGEEWLSNEQSATFLLRSGKLFSLEGEAPFGVSDSFGVIRIRYGTVQGAAPPAGATIELGRYKPTP